MIKVVWRDKDNGCWHKRYKVTTEAAMALARQIRPQSDVLWVSRRGSIQFVC